MTDIFAPPAWQARADAVTLISASLPGETAEMQAVTDHAEETWWGALIHATLNLYRALALRLRTPTAIDLDFLDTRDLPDSCESKFFADGFRAIFFGPDPFLFQPVFAQIRLGQAIIRQKRRRGNRCAQADFGSQDRLQDVVRGGRDHAGSVHGHHRRDRQVDLAA